MKFRTLIGGRPATVRDLHEFRRAKETKREPIRGTFKAVGQGIYIPTDLRSLLVFREQLRHNPSFGAASEMVDRLEYEYRLRGHFGFPMPRKIIQNPTGELSWLFKGLSFCAAGDRLVFLIGGTAGVQGVGIKPELLNALESIANQQHGRRSSTGRGLAG